MTTFVGILVSKSVVTMSSREVADLTGKRHSDVKRDIRVMMTQLSEDVGKFLHTYLDSMNRAQIEYLLDRDHAECLLTGYDTAIRIKVIYRLRELEDKNKIPQTLPESLHLAADLAKKGAA